ncbi:hypothetical protein chiPu_0033017, partial [Chiloscyllium punctatum]|nr:hypothetical protein [Chiloscyllium punctatum]
MAACARSSAGDAPYRRRTAGRARSPGTRRAVRTGCRRPGRSISPAHSPTPRRRAPRARRAATATAAPHGCRRPGAGPFAICSVRTRPAWLFRNPHFDSCADHAHSVRLQLHLRCGQALPAGEIVLKAVMRTGDYAVLDLSVMDRETEMRTRVLEA